MSKYEPLGRYLSSHGGRTFAAHFQELEDILGFRLPESARRYPAWWANQGGAGHAQSAAWQTAGWMTRNLDLNGERVEFQRNTAKVSASSSNPHSNDGLLEQARRFTGIDDRDGLIEAALGALVEREAARWLARRGGTMPGLEAPARARAGT